MRRWLWLVLIAAAAIALYSLPRNAKFWLPERTTRNATPHPQPPDGSKSPATDPRNTSDSPASAIAPDTTAAPDKASTPNKPPREGPVVPPETLLENVRLAIRNYGSVFGGNPIGTNPEITKALSGGNRKQTQFIASDSGLEINDRGELIDSWNTPYFFHQLSRTEMEIRSAGPDRVLWTSDDLVTK